MRGRWQRWQQKATLATVMLTMIASCTPSSTEAPTRTHAISSEARPLSDLPGGAEAPPGMLTLWADYEAAGADEVPLYLVNRTGDPIELPAEDGDPYVKLEARTDDGQWHRAQRHVFSSCGLSYQPVVLAPGEFLRLRQWFPTEGEPAQVRYAIHGDLELTSNPGIGHIDPKELEAARLDALSAKSADVAALEEILEAHVGSADWEDQSAIDTALRRLGALGGEDAAALLERFLDRSEVDANAYSRAIDALNDADPVRLAEYLRHRLAEPPGRRRDRVVDELPFAPRLASEPLLRDLIAIARDPSAPEVPRVLDYLAGFRREEIAALLLEVQKDSRYPVETRIRARYDHEQWYGDEGVSLRLRAPGSWSDGHPRPVRMSIELENGSDHVLRFSYDDPSELVSLYLSLPHGRDQTFLPPRAGVRWFQPTRTTGAITVVLRPGERHTLSMAVGDYFEIPPAPPDGLTVWASVKIPGEQAVARLAGGGAGINPVER
ncbi:hypothetical protein [Paraliomyxa miuraensis]|uniref:hypothetical protein n=1 Tax=Paraliomyxa miuraensis TaxID=376150 RepID=UPI00225A512D|nr:hypothetical protein [Paraliomyxa miuraensis]MCX4242970.1 hypothetical protein [Paraliomyxa miuraensis]